MTSSNTGIWRPQHDMSAELNFLSRPQSPNLARCRRTIDRTSTRRELDPRRTSGRVPAAGSLRASQSLTHSESITEIGPEPTKIVRDRWWTRRFRSAGVAGDGVWIPNRDSPPPFVGRC